MADNKWSEEDVDDPTIMDIDILFRIPLVGERNNAIMWCPQCGYEHEYTLKDCIGFASYEREVVSIIECPVCFTKHFHHLRSMDMYCTFLRQIALGGNKHFDKSIVDNIKNNGRQKI